MLLEYLRSPAEQSATPRGYLQLLPLEFKLLPSLEYRLLPFKGTYCCRYWSTVCYPSRVPTAAVTGVPVATLRGYLLLPLL